MWSMQEGTQYKGLQGQEVMLAVLRGKLQSMGDQRDRGRHGNGPRRSTLGPVVKKGENEP